MYMIWHKKLGLIRQYKYRILAVLWCWLHGNDECIEVVNGRF